MWVVLLSYLSHISYTIFPKIGFPPKFAFQQLHALALLHDSVRSYNILHQMLLMIRSCCPVIELGDCPFTLRGMVWYTHTDWCTVVPLLRDHPDQRPPLLRGHHTQGASLVFSPLNKDHSSWKATFCEPWGGLSRGWLFCSMQVSCIRPFLSQSKWACLQTMIAVYEWGRI